MPIQSEYSFDYIVIERMLPTNFRTYKKVQKKSILNQRKQDNLEKKLEEIKDASKWESILKLTFEVNILQ